jgi:hypothetical protein
MGCDGLIAATTDKQAGTKKGWELGVGVCLYACVYNSQAQCNPFS